MRPRSKSYTDEEVLIWLESRLEKLRKDYAKEQAKAVKNPKAVKDLEMLIGTYTRRHVQISIKMRQRKDTKAEATASTRVQRLARAAEKRRRKGERRLTINSLQNANREEPNVQQR